MELHEALSQIAEIRQQMARTHLFRGYRSMTAILSGALAILAAAFQPMLVPDPGRDVTLYVMLWGGVALLSVLIVGTEIAVRYCRMDSPLHREVTLLAVEQLIPALIAGAMTTGVLMHFAHGATWMLPGLWAVFFSLGIFASRRILPRAIQWVARYYLLAGLVLLSFDDFGRALSPLSMGITFGLGQTLAAAVLYFTLERRHGSESE